MGLLGFALPSPAGLSAYSWLGVEEWVKKGHDKDSGLVGTGNTQLKAWVHEMARMGQPDAVHWCVGSRREWLCELMLKSGTFVRLDPDRVC